MAISLSIFNPTCSNLVSRHILFRHTKFQLHLFYFESYETFWCLIFWSSFSAFSFMSLTTSFRLNLADPLSFAVYWLSWYFQPIRFIMSNVLTIFAGRRVPYAWRSDSRPWASSLSIYQSLRVSMWIVVSFVGVVSLLKSVCIRAAVAMKVSRDFLLYPSCMALCSPMVCR